MTALDRLVPMMLRVAIAVLWLMLVREMLR